MLLSKDKEDTGVRVRCPLMGGVLSDGKSSSSERFSFQLCEKGTDV